MSILSGITDVTKFGNTAGNTVSSGIIQATSSDAYKLVDIASAAYGKLFSHHKPSKYVDRYSLPNFVSKLQEDGMRIAKGYYYQASIIMRNIHNPALLDLLAFHCNSAQIPGYRVGTQKGKIYGLSYEVATELEQDPIYLTFSIDVMHQIEEFFITAQKNLIFSTDKSYSPHYKSDYQFEMSIQVTDENFVPIRNYILNSTMIKTVQNVSYGHSKTDVQEITVELVYETITSESLFGNRKPLEPKKPLIDIGKIPLGGFAPLSNIINQTTTSAPSWFNPN